MRHLYPSKDADLNKRHANLWLWVSLSLRTFFFFFGKKQDYTVGAYGAELYFCKHINSSCMDAQTVWNLSFAHRMWEGGSWTTPEFTKLDSKEEPKVQCFTVGRNKPDIMLKKSKFFFTTREWWMSSGLYHLDFVVVSSRKKEMTRHIVESFLSSRLRLISLCEK